MSGKCHPESSRSRDNNTVDSVLEMYLLDAGTRYIVTATVEVTSSPGWDTDRQIGGPQSGEAEVGPRSQGRSDQYRYINHLS